MILTEELKQSIINKTVIQKDDFHPKIFHELILFSWKFIDFKSDFISWIQLQNKSIKFEIESATCSFAREQFKGSHLTKTGMKSICDHLQDTLNAVSSKASLVKAYRKGL